MVSFSAGISLLNYLLLISSIKKLREMAQNRNKVRVIRKPNPNPVEIDSEELVPGDALVIEGKMTIPCDCVILRGEVTMNEASLTGESVPVAKEGLPKVIDGIRLIVGFECIQFSVGQTPLSF